MAATVAWRAVPAVAALIGLAWVALPLISDEPAGRVRAAFTSATNLTPGVEARVAGRKVGEVESSDYVDGQAIVELRVDDERVWPLHRGTVARLRFGSTVAVTTRHVDLALGPESAPVVPDGGLLTRSETVAPVEFDEVFDVLDRDARDDLKGLVSNTAAALDGRSAALGHALEDAPRGFDAFTDMMRELGADPAALTTLVAAGDRTSRAIASRDAELRELLTTAAATFDELADRAEPAGVSLERLPSTLRQSRATLAHLDRSLGGLGSLVEYLRPGARRLRLIAPTASRAVSALDTVAPLANATLAVGGRAAPDIRQFLELGLPFMDRLDRVLAKTAPIVACIRPYGPELAGFTSTWGAFLKNHDAHDHYARVLLQAPPVLNGTPQTPEQVVGSHPGLRYAFPQPPGLGAGQAWLQPDCGAGAGALDASQDPERAR